MASMDPFYISDLPALREKLARAERNSTQMGRVWSAVRRRARSSPQNFPWFTPFVGLISGDDCDFEPARAMIRSYLQHLQVQSFGSGLQFHFWCFAFPHARWALYFQWLQALGAWTPEEEKSLGEEFVIQQFTNFFFGMRNKPEPECVDNQALSLCFSNALVGHLFSQQPFESEIAKRMMRDGIRRLPGMIGGMPPSGYSGEGSTYMDHVVGPALPFLVEFLERTQGGNWFDRNLEPAGGSAAAICRMIGREWMLNGLYLPWDHYGYGLPMRSCIAYAAHKSGDPFYSELLENHASWNHDGMIGWGFDDLIWSLIWWPDQPSAQRATAFPSWAEPEVGAALVSQDSQFYLMQMWDQAEPIFPEREQVNPNSLVLSAYGVPLSVDGVPDQDICSIFNYDDTWREVSYMDLSSRRFNFGCGCAGSHSVILVDGWEGLRPLSHYQQAEMLHFDGQSVTTDVTPLYREHWHDTQQVVRRSRLCGERFWLIEDSVLFEKEHEVTARFWLRPSLQGAGRGVTIETAEGVRLHLFPLLGSDKKEIREIAGHPDRLDGASLRVDWKQRGKQVSWLWLAWPENSRRELENIADSWDVICDADQNLEFEDARRLLRLSPLQLPLTSPADMLADVPPCPRWWYRRTVQVPDTKKWWLRLPRQLQDARLWAAGQEINLDDHRMRMQLLQPHIAMNSGFEPGQEIEIIVRCNVSINQYEDGGRGGSGFFGSPAIIVPQDVPELAAQYENGRVLVRAGDESWNIEHPLWTCGRI